MKKLIPFNITQAKAGAKVVTETGREITIVNFDSKAIPGWPIIGLYSVGDVDHYELWPASGDFTEIDTLGRKEPLPPKLMIEVEVSEVDYEGVGDELIRLRKEVVEIQGYCDQYKKANEEFIVRNRELEVINDRLRLEREKSLADIKSRETHELNQLRGWKESALESLKRWDEVEAYINQSFDPSQWGTAVQNVVLSRLRKLDELQEKIKHLNF